MIVTDASIWVSSLIHGDVNRAASRRWLREQTERGVQLFAPILLLAEVAGATARRSGRPRVGQRALEDLEMLEGLELVAVDATLGRASAVVALSVGLRGADAVYVALAQDLGARLVTWDREQLTRGAAVVPTSTPEQELAADDA